MTSSSGGDFLSKKSRLMRDQSEMLRVLDALVVDDEPRDSDRMLATLRVMYGYDVSVRRAATIAAALAHIATKHPDLILLDDILKPSDNGETTLPLIRQTGFIGPVIVISGQVTRTRRPILIAAGATDVIHKDDVDSVRLAESLKLIFAGKYV
ncbi:MAG: response regulator [Hyphomicrobium sp.]|nr:response regulator [Hyphomicrobium sp.]